LEKIIKLIQKNENDIASVFPTGNKIEEDLDNHSAVFEQYILSRLEGDQIKADELYAELNNTVQLLANEFAKYEYNLSSEEINAFIKTHVDDTINVTNQIIDTGFTSEVDDFSSARQFAQLLVDHMK
jgi:hypothetical protein